MELTPRWKCTLGWPWQWLMRHATVSAQPNLRSQFKTSTQPLNLSPYGPMRVYVPIPACSHPSGLLFLVWLFFFPSLGMILQSYTGNQIDFFVLAPPSANASDNEPLLLLEGSRWEGWFQLCLSSLSCALGKKWSSDSYVLKTVALKNITPRPGIVKSKNLELVLQIHFLMKRNAEPPIVSGPSIRFPDSGIKQQTVWGRASFPALISACSRVLCFILEP